MESIDLPANRGFSLLVKSAANDNKAALTVHIPFRCANVINQKPYVVVPQCHCRVGGIN